jgi:hypothetical protein
MARPRILCIVAAWVLAASVRAPAQNRGVYPLGLSALNSGVTPQPGFSYSNQLLFYVRDEAKDDRGQKLASTGRNFVVMDMNSFIWVSRKKFLGAHYSATATLPFAKNNLSSDINGNISGGAGFADSYYIPAILGWDLESAAIRVMYGFLAPTGRYVSTANNNVGSGYWTHTVSSGQTFYPVKSKVLALSLFQMYEFHTTQEGTGVHPGGTFDLDYSLMASVSQTEKVRFQMGLVGYEQRQTTARTGPDIASSTLHERYAVNGIGIALNGAFPRRKASLNLRLIKEFANRSTFQGYSVQLAGAISFR